MITRHTHDRRGRLVRSISRSEPVWTEQDRAELLALALYRASLCPCGCGHAHADTTSHEQTGPVFTATRTMCRARRAQLEAAREADGQKSNPDASARLWTVHMKRK